jgi:excisionase family DNA binding protein
MNEVYSTSEAAALLGVTRQRVSKLCETGQLKSKRIGKFLFPLRYSVEQYKRQIKERTARAPKVGTRVPTYLKTKK